MKKTISNPESCEVRAVIRFLHAKSLNAAEIHRQLCVVYGPNVMSQRKVSSWCKQFSEGRTNVHDEERSGRPSIVSDDIVEQVTNKMCENRRLTISELTSHFPHISRSLIHEIVTRRFQYHKVHGMWIPKMIGTYSLEEERMDSAFNFLERTQNKKKRKPAKKRRAASESDMSSEASKEADENMSEFDADQAEVTASTSSEDAGLSASICNTEMHVFDDITIKSEPIDETHSEDENYILGDLALQEEVPDFK